MNCSPKLLFGFFLFSFLFLNRVARLAAQSITPFTLNNGGGSSEFSDWSMGESVSIAHFSSQGYTLNTGVLQPLTSIITSLYEFGPAIFGNEILIGPNPSINRIHIKANFKQIGQLSIQLLDTKLSIVETHEGGRPGSKYEHVLSIVQYPAGILYLRVLFKSLNGLTKSGIFKIIKL